MHIGGKFRRDNVQRPEVTRALWKTRVCHAQQHGQKPEELSFEEFREVLSLVKPNVATGRDNVPGTIVRFLPESVLNQLYRAIVDRLAGRERMLTSTAGRSLIFAWFRRKVTFQSCPTGVRFPWFLHCTKCVKCACGRLKIKSSDRFRVSWWGSGPVCSVS